MISVEKPGSPSEILEHVGVKGMKWGVRKAVDTAIGTKTAGRKPSSYKKSSTSPSFKQRFPTHEARRTEILRARSATSAREAKIALATTPGERQKATQVYLKNPDRATAMRMTRGEKVVTTILAVGLAAPSAGVVPAAIVGYTGTTVAIRKGIERKQARK